MAAGALVSAVGDANASLLPGYRSASLMYEAKPTLLVRTHPVHIPDREMVEDLETEDVLQSGHPVAERIVDRVVVVGKSVGILRN